MDENTRDGYAVEQLARAFVTALTHEDPATRRRADERVRRWRAVLRGIAGGTLTVGSREPVAGFPAWVTPVVVHGGFATGEPAAGGPLREHELATCARFGLPARRRALAAHHLAGDGLAELLRMVDTGGYRVDLPEQAALPVLAWLLRAGDEDAARELFAELAPFADRLRFTPVPAPPAGGPDVVWRGTAGQAAAALAARGPNRRVEAMREALAVWNPFADELLGWWLDGDLGESADPSWHERGAALLALYRELAATHTRCAKHRRPKENLAVLRHALEEVVAGRELTPRTRGLLRHAAGSMVRRRGEPGSARHGALRARQAAQLDLPTHHATARVVVRRLAALPPDRGVPDVAELCAPVDGAPVPPAIRRVVTRALAGTVEELVDAGAVPSAEVLARLVPRIAATTTAAAYPDEALRTLVAATYLAFRNRRSLLLTDLRHQVRVDELPWVRALARHRAPGEGARHDALAALRRLGELALDAFPGTILPNTLVRELAVLGREAGVDLPWVEQLAADIFEGRFSAKFARAAEQAGEHLHGGLYARYHAMGRGRVDDFAALCRERSGVRERSGARGWSVAGNHAVIEQAQVLTTHNLVTLVGHVGVRADWPDLARRAFGTATALAARVPTSPRPGATAKLARDAWRQAVFFLSEAGSDTPPDWLREHRGPLVEQVGELVRCWESRATPPRASLPRATPPQSR
ncbi:hypothetical protein Q5530_36185 [Saccharothrix sp. BKS2]|uniref:hypothetical protein n=1 Tax=Saccharothrix sp. BKS2 TaxID=3064400 RepID=UPI0039EAD590